MSAQVLERGMNGLTGEYADGEVIKSFECSDGEVD